jgi:hypothetical protein
MKIILKLYFNFKYSKKIQSIVDGLLLYFSSFISYIDLITNNTILNLIK